MTDIVIHLPDLPVQQLPSISAFAALRALPSSSLVSGEDYAVDGSDAFGDGGGGLFVWIPSSTADDDDATVIKPSDLGPLQAGRWILSGNKQMNAKLRAELILYTPEGTGGVASNAAAKLKRADIQPQEYGALGDGSNDYTALVRAGNAAAAAGVWLDLNGKTYGLDQTWNAVAGLKIRDGNFVAIDNALISGAMLKYTGIDDFQMRNVQFDGNADNHGADYGLWVKGGTGHRLENFTAHDTAQAGLYWEEVDDYTGSNIALIDCGRLNRVGAAGGTDNHGIMIVCTGAIDTTNGRFTNVYIDHAYRKGFATYSGSTGAVKGLPVNNLVAKNCGLGGWYVGSAPGATYSEGIVLTNASFRDNYVSAEWARCKNSSASNITSINALLYDAIIADACDGISLSNLSTENADSHSVFVTSASGQSKNITINGVTVKNCNQSGAGFGGAVVLENTINASVGLITAVDTDGNMTHGVVETGTSDYNVVGPCNIIGASAADIELIGAHSRDASPPPHIPYGFNLATTGTIAPNDGISIRIAGSGGPGVTVTGSSVDTSYAASATHNLPVANASSAVVDLLKNSTVLATVTLTFPDTGDYFVSANGSANQNGTNYKHLVTAWAQKVTI